MAEEMHLTIPGPALKALATMGAQVALTNTSVPAHGYIHLIAKKDGKGQRLVAEAFDGDLHWTASDGGGQSKIEVIGEAVVRADQFKRLVDALPPGEVTLQVIGQRMLVLANRSRNQLALLNPAEYPAMSFKPNEAERGEIQARDLARFITVLGGFTAGDNKAVIHCMQIANTDEAVEAVATDGYRAAITGSPGSVGENPILLTARQRKVIAGYLKGCAPDDGVSVSSDKHTLVVQANASSRITCRLMSEEATYPPYRKLLSATPLATLEFPVPEMRAALGRALLVARDDTTANKVMLTPTEEGLSITASTQHGEANEEVIGSWDGSIAEHFVVNGAYLESALVGMPERAKLLLTGQKNPIQVDAVTGDDEDPLTVVLMPIIS